MSKKVLAIVSSPRKNGNTELLVDGLDIRFMLQCDQTMGIPGIAWATPFADWVALAISLALFVPCIRRMNAGIGLSK